MFELTSFLAASPRRVVLTTHWNPDGDAVGSTLGLQAVLEDLGHTVHAVFPNRPSANLAWMPRLGRALMHDEQPDAVNAVLEHAEVVFALDYNAWNRAGEALGAVLARFSGPTALIDHHLQPDSVFTHSLSDIRASSTCELVERWVHNELQPRGCSSDAATCLFTGMLTDTGSFRYPSTSAETLRAAARMLDSGAVPESIHTQLFDASSPQKMHLWGEALRSMDFLEEGKMAVLTLDRPTLEHIGYQKGDTDGLVNQGLAVEGVEVSAFFREEAAGVKISFRSKGDRDVNAFSRSFFNGGGHKNAAGGFWEGTLEEALDRLKKSARGWLAVGVFSMLAGAFSACQRLESDPLPESTSAPRTKEEDLIEQHRAQLTSERKALDAFIQDRGWTLEKGGTGWRLWRVESGAGSALKSGDAVSLTARATDLKNRTFYTHTASDPLEFRVGRDNVGELGLHEVLLQSRRGDSLILILPAHLAHGVAGDLGKIPPMSPVVYYLRVR